MSHVWRDLAKRVGDATVAATRLTRIMAHAGGPTTPADIGVSSAFFAGAVRNARFLRDRYTFLDLADDSGYLARRWPL